MSLLSKLLKHKRPAVIIFGTGGLATLVTRTIKREVQILGYADNNTSMHGKRFMGKEIMPACKIQNCQFEKLIIASQFYKEIVAGLEGSGLISNEAIPRGKIVYFDQFISSVYNNSLFDRVRHQLFEWLSLFDNPLTRVLINGLFVEKGHQLARVRWLDEQKESVVTTLSEAIEFVSRPPRIIGQYNPTVTVEIPHLRLYKFSNASVDTSSRTFIVNDFLIIERGFNKNFEQGDYSGGRLAKYGRKLSIVKSYVRDELTRAILVNAVSSTNYYHCLVEMLPQLFYINALGEEYSDYPIAIPTDTLSIPSINDCFQLLNPTREIIQLDSDKEYLVKDLLVITTPNNNLAVNLRNGMASASHNYLRKESIEFIRDAAVKALTASSTELRYSNKVYIGRRGPIRSFNQEAVIELLQIYGFQCFFTEEMTFMQQVSLFQHADFIVGPTGAAWTNLMFAKNGARALCWQATNLGDFSCFSNLAQVNNVEMQYLTYTTKGKLTRELFWESYEISTDKIKNWLDEHVVN